MTTPKSSGVTPTEQLLAEFGEGSFLKLWSYANPFGEEGKELCDLLAVFRDTAFIFFDRQSKLTLTPEKDPYVVWARWKRTAIDACIFRRNLSTRSSVS